MSDVPALYARFGVRLAGGRRTGWGRARCFTGSHDDRRASCMVNLDGGQFRCHACGVKGGVLDALQLLGVYDRDEARRLAIEYGAEGVERRRSRPPLPGLHRGVAAGGGSVRAASSTPSNQVAKREGPERVDWDALPATPTLTRAWVYLDAAGNEVGRICRSTRADGSKAIWAERKAGNRFVPGLDGMTLPLYRLPDVLKRARKGERVIVVEGEKCVDALDTIGLFATCNPGGAGKWWPEYTRALRGASVVVFADCDKEGRLHALRVTQELHGAGVTVTMPVDIAPYNHDGFDIYDELAAVAETIRAVPPNVAPEMLRYRIRWMLLDHVYAKYLRTTLPANGDALRDKIERLQATADMPLRYCPSCGRERPHRTAAGLVYCPCGAFRPERGGQSAAA